MFHKYLVVFIALVACNALQCEDHPNDWILKPEKNKTTTESAPFVCPMDPPLGFRVYTLRVDEQDRVHNVGYWDQLDLRQRADLEHAFTRGGHLSNSSQEKKVLLIVFGINDARKAQQLRVLDQVLIV